MLLFVAYCYWAFAIYDGPHPKELLKIGGMLGMVPFLMFLL
ncbi:MAG: hypothetical protein WD845_08065 [Pirellulales bacterium]